MKSILVLISSLLFVFGCRPERDRHAESAEFKRLLIETVAAADTIVVAEHSDPVDFDSPSPEITYRITNLTGQQKDQLLQQIEKSSDRPQETWSACFIPHHSIRFFNGTIQSATLEVCLECRGIRFSRSNFNPPDELVPMITAFVTDLGFRPATHEEWETRAKRQSGQTGGNQGVFPEETVDSAGEELHKLQKTSLMLKTCPDGHSDLKDIPILYGLFGIQVKDPEDWNDDDRALAKRRDSHEVVLGTDALVGGEPRFQPTCLTCGYHYRVRSVPDEDGGWIKSGGRFSDFSTGFSSAAKSLPFASLPNLSIVVGVREGTVVTEQVSVTLPMNGREEVIANLGAWIAANGYRPSLLKIDPPLPDLSALDAEPISSESGKQVLENGNAEFDVTIMTGGADFTATFHLLRRSVIPDIKAGR